MQTFTAPLNTTYKIECWGASGGQAQINYSGCGGYVSGEILLTKFQTLYVYIGQRGNNVNQYSSTYMFNGGGYANVQGTYCGACGGGATDIRTTSGDWDNSTSLNSRIMIAAGGGGVNGYENVFGCAGGLDGYDGIVMDAQYQIYQGKGATQTAGGAAPETWTGSQNGTAGTLGKGGIGGRNNESTTYGGGSGGGGGLYGGSGSSGMGFGVWSGGGGSSYISGHPGCMAKTLTFTNTIMIDGAGYEWTSIKGEQVGIPTTANQSIRQNRYVGNGYCIISWKSPSL